MSIITSPLPVELADARCSSPALVIEGDATKKTERDLLCRVNGDKWELGNLARGDISRSFTDNVHMGNLLLETPQAPKGAPVVLKIAIPPPPDEPPRLLAHNNGGGGGGGGGGRRRSRDEKVPVVEEPPPDAFEALKYELTMHVHIAEHGFSECPKLIAWNVNNACPQPFMLMTHVGTPLNVFLMSVTDSSWEDTWRGCLTASVEALRDFHATGALHNDLHPGNIIVSSTSPAGRPKVAFIDFGLATLWRDALDNKTHLPDVECRVGRGMLDVVSHNLHRRHTPSRRDDLISLVHTFVWLWQGNLPWTDLCAAADAASSGRVREEVGLAKERAVCNVWERAHMFRGMPSELMCVYRHAVHLQYHEPPNYAKILKALA